MKRALVGAFLALALCAGTARGDTFAVVQTGSYTIEMDGVPSAQVPNSPGSLALPSNWTSSAGETASISAAQLRGLWQSAASAYSIPWPVLAAINKIESNFGRNMGPSSAGAVGWMQFMPDTWLRWGADFSGDGVADPWNPTDAVYSAARYLAAAGGSNDISRAIFAYNHAQWYVDEVLSLARLLGGDAALTFSLDEMQVDLEQASKRVAKLSQQMARIRTQARKIRTRAQRAYAAAERLPLISERTAARMRAGAVEEQARALEARLPALAGELEQAEGELEQARSDSEANSFATGTAVYLSGPLFQNGYVFPVGGGPSRVAVGHTHHDYPAADIAAPSGTPVYALADGVVIDAWSTTDSLCGIGMRFRSDDGKTWAYCHFSYIEPDMTAGVRLSAGTRVGLVGSTGNSTGPHLHLGLLPSSEGFPQNEPWFQSFAGIAYRWKDAPTPQIAAAATVGAPVELTVVGGAGSWAITSGPASPAISVSAGAAIAPAPFGAPPSDSP